MKEVGVGREEGVVVGRASDLFYEGGVEGVC